LADDERLAGDVDDFGVDRVAALAAGISYIRRQCAI
jgi:hypothetical protein